MCASGSRGLVTLPDAHNQSNLPNRVCTSLLAAVLICAHVWRSCQFVEKDPKLADPVLRSLLKFWPLTNSQKEVLFLGELEEVLELTQVPPHLHSRSSSSLKLSPPCAKTTIYSC